MREYPLLRGHLTIAEREVREQEAPDFLPDQVGRLAAEHAARAAQMRLLRKWTVDATEWEMCSRESPTERRESAMRETDPIHMDCPGRMREP